MKIEHISWVSLTTWWSSKKERHLSVGDGLLGKIVIDNKGVLGVITEVLSNGASRVWSQELEWSGIRGGGSDNHGVFEGVSLVEESHNVGDGGSLLSDSDVDAVEGLVVVTGLEGSLLVKDSINGDGSLTSLTISNDKLTLSSANWDLYSVAIIRFESPCIYNLNLSINELGRVIAFESLVTKLRNARVINAWNHSTYKRVNSLKSSLHWLMDRLSWDNTWSLQLNSLTGVRLNWSLSVDSISEWINNTSEHALTDWDIDNGSGSLDDITLLDLSVNRKIVSIKLMAKRLTYRYPR